MTETGRETTENFIDEDKARRQFYKWSYLPSCFKGDLSRNDENVLETGSQGLKRPSKPSTLQPTAQASSLSTAPSAANVTGDFHVRDEDDDEIRSPTGLSARPLAWVLSWPFAPPAWRRRLVWVAILGGILASAIIFPVLYQRKQDEWKRLRQRDCEAVGARFEDSFNADLKVVRYMIFLGTTAIQTPF